jgi:long-chain acyl-CoA synthetase
MSARPVIDRPIDPDIQTAARTIAGLPTFAAGRYPTANLVCRCSASGITSMTGRELADRVRDVSLGLSTLGVAKGDRVALVSESRPEWLVADFAILSAGAATTPIYPTLPVDQTSYILRDSGARLAVVSSAEIAAKIVAASADARELRTIVIIDAPADGLPAGGIEVVTLDEVAARGHRRILDAWGVAREFRDQVAAIGPDDLATIVYTSGTSGAPKGVMLTHGNLTANLAGISDALDLRDDDVGLSFLPLSHALERIVAYIYLTTGVSMVFAESFDTIARDLRTARPTVMASVPRVFEKLHARIQERAGEGSRAKRAFVRWALSVAARRGAALEAGRPVTGSLALASRLAERTVFSEIRAGLGGRLRLTVSGSAPLDPALGRFFLGLGLPVLEGYGLTEAAPVVSVTRLGAPRFGTVGPPLPNVEVKMAADGEILVRGANVMRGYYQRPSDTAAAIVDGWLHTGDIGALEDGYLRITDRKKELLVTSGGKKVAPQPIEERLRAHPLVREAVVVGDGRHFPSALLVPDFAALDARLGTSTADLATRCEASDVRALFQAAVDTANAPLASFERIKKFALLPTEFTQQTGELTPTLKVRRRVIEERYRAVIDAMYE